MNKTLSTMQNKINLSQSEVRALQSFQLKGCLGKCGSMNISQRRALLTGLISKGLLTANCTLTPLGIELSKPSNFYEAHDKKGTARRVFIPSK